ncbi:hypothetical protein Ac2012v2_005293 [Leucoagaricus gongylophorus]
MISRFAKSLFIIILAIFILAVLAMLHPPSRAYIDPWTGQLFGEGGVEKTLKSYLPMNNSIPKPIVGVEGGVIMTKLGNETTKAALGRATWKFLHTVTLRFPEHPTIDERETLEEFQELLKRFPPQTSSRRAASLWLCRVHNEVNKRLKKAEFDCANLSTEYDCGCGDDPLNSTSTLAQTLDDLEHDTSEDEITGARLIQGGR